MKSVYIYGGILILSLGLASQQWTKKPSRLSGEEVFVLYGEEATLESIVWDSEKDRTELSFRSDARGSYIWAEYTDKKNEKTPKREFKVGEKGKKLVENLSPLIAIRHLKDVSPEKQKEIGLHDPKTTMSIVRKGKETIFSVGGEAYGTKDIYVQNTQSKEIFLLDDTKLRTLKSARTQLPDKRVTDLTAKEINKLTINASLEQESKTIVVEHKNKEDAKQSRWIRLDNPDGDNKQLTNWITQFLRNKSREYASNIEESKLTQAFSVVLETETDRDELIVYHDADQKKWYAKSKHTRALVVLYPTKMTDLYKDLPALFDSEPLPEEEETSSEEQKNESPPKK